ncbi:Putative Protein kinase superfamily protein [Klebsormidium nitens]|uniref:Protein kinase domain-containing protein n=1 Tax=Klebsormidium nitens TaxID=105231 RepID=A0A1Y1HYQ0_KLENI|nr:Putative Protein kinase superfamily protein [Klebsormidium nitens]|eukprot:GAQ82862.1 Putative Protein kinase superfamily protein [Klebsormidium nitens]
MPVVRDCVYSSLSAATGFEVVPAGGERLQNAREAPLVDDGEISGGDVQEGEQEGVLVQEGGEEGDVQEGGEGGRRQEEEAEVEFLEAGETEIEPASSAAAKPSAPAPLENQAPEFQPAPVPQTTDSQTEQSPQDLTPVGLFSGDAFAIEIPRAASANVMLFSQTSVNPFSGASYPPLPEQSLEPEAESTEKSSKSIQKKEIEKIDAREQEVEEVRTAEGNLETIWGEPVAAELRGEAEGAAEMDEGPIHTTLEEAQVGRRGDDSGAEEQRPSKGPLDHLFADFACPPKFVSKWKLVKELGRGGEAVVYHVRAADEAGTWRDYAMKVELPGEDGRYLNNQINEARFMDACRGPRVMPLAGYALVRGRVALLLPLADAAAPLFVAGRVLASAADFYWATWLGLEIARGVGDIHRAGVVHRDVKLDNVHLLGGVPCVSDFGLALRPHEAAASGVTSTAGYCPPEAHDRQSQDMTGDIFAAGVTFYTLVTGRLPSDGFTFDIELRLHLADGGRYPWPAECRAVGQPLIDIVEACWEQDAAARPTAAHLARRLELLLARMRQLVKAQGGDVTV